MSNVVPGYVSLSGGQATFTNDMIKKLESFAADGIDYRYDIEPRSDNLFYAGFFREGDELSPGSNQQRPFYNAAYRIKKVTVNLPKLSFEFNKFTHVPQLDKVMYDLTIGIDWIEDVYHSVQRYHLDWLQRWYNRSYDVLRCGPEGKFRRMCVIAFHYVNMSQNYSGVIEVPGIQPVFAIDIAGMVPEDFGDFAFDYSSDGADQAVSCKYKAAHAYWLHNKDLSGPDSIWGKMGTAPPNMPAWGPTKFSQDAFGERGQDEDGQFERLRITRNVTDFMVDNSRL